MLIECSFDIEGEVSLPEGQQPIQDNRDDMQGHNCVCTATQLPDRSRRPGKRCIASRSVRGTKEEQEREEEETK